MHGVTVDRMRVANWPEVLSQKIERDRDVPFAWGTHDCIAWACSVCELLCGINPSRVIGTRYASTREAKALVDQHGGTILELARYCARACDISEIPPRLAQRGDVVCVTHDRPEPFRMALAVCVGKVAIATGRKGLVTVPMHTTIAAWRI
jgi:hypothetical protein